MRTEDMYYNEQKRSEVMEAARRLRRKFLRYQQAEIVYSLSHKKLMEFFRAKDVDVMTAAFREYAGVAIKKSRKPSIRKKLQKAIQRTAKHRERVKTRQKDRGQER